MKTYTAKQITEILQKEGADVNLRTIRYYTQIGVVPNLDLIGNKRVYTEKHIHYFRAILVLARTGETLASIQNKLLGLNLDEVKKIGDQFYLYQSNKILEHETLKVNDDVYISMGKNYSPELKQKVINSVSQILRGGSNQK